MGAESDVDLLVVGAGPAGIAAALTAHRAGLSVRCVDRATFPRDKTCGDGLTAGALRWLERLGVPVPALAATQPVDTVMVRSPSGRIVTLPMPADGHHALVTPRAGLDDALVARARAEGVEVAEGEGVTSATVDPDGVVVTHGGRSTAARSLIAADGHYSAVRRLVDPGRPDLGSSHAFRQYFRGVHDRRLWVIFEPDLLPGYAWVFPLPGDRANVGFGVARDADLRGRTLAGLWRGLLDRPAVRAVLGPDAEPEGRPRAWPIPADFAPARLSAGPVLFAGDAAGVVDPMTGEGVAQALETGVLAAHAVAAGGPAAAIAARYRASTSRAIGRDLRWAAAIRQVLRSDTGTRGALRLVDLGPWTRRNFARWMFEDYPRALLGTPDRWRPGALTPPGAFRSPFASGT
ncbi:MAG: geranylgeranyl reductase family protein [Actinomycetota bacterium]